MHLHTQSLATRATLAVFSLSLFVIFALSTFQLILDYHEQVEQVENQIEGLEASVISVVSRSLWTYDQDQLRSILLGLRTLPYVQFVQIETDGVLLMEQGVPPKSPIAKETAIRSPAPPFPVIGVLRIASEKKNIQANLWKKAKSIILSNFLLIMLISGLTITIFQYKITKPLIELSEFASQIQINSLTRSIAPERLKDEHEVGRVYRAIDKMQKNIQKDFQTILEAEAELEKYKNNLEKLVAERTEKLIETTKNLVSSSRKAGMAEVAIGVLHNIGNALTGVNVKVQTLFSSLQNESPVSHLKDLVGLMESQGEKLGSFLDQEERGKKIVPYLKVIHHELQLQHDNHIQTINMLRKDLGTVSQIISKQQSHAKFTCTIENIPLAECLEDILGLQAYEIEKYQVKVEKKYVPKAAIASDRHKLIQILTNLISNALQAMHSNLGSRILNLEIDKDGEQYVIHIRDNGVGIAEDQMAHIFRYGYTTKKAGHGFGLHSCSIDAKLLGGSISCYSLGKGLGSTFSLHVPVFAQTFANPSDEEILSNWDSALSQEALEWGGLKSS